MGRNKRKGITKEVTNVYYGIYEENNLKESFNKEMDETTFLNAFRLLKTYEERKHQLENRKYTLVSDDWEMECGKNITSGDAVQFYHKTFTINKVGEIEKWVKRKPFNLIKHDLLKSSKIKQKNPYTSFTVKDDKGNDQTFFKKR